MLEKAKLDEVGLLPSSSSSPSLLLPLVELFFSLPRYTQQMSLKTTTCVNEPCWISIFCELS